MKPLLQDFSYHRQSNVRNIITDFAGLTESILYLSNMLSC